MEASKAELGELIRERQDYRNAIQSIVLLAIAAGAFVAYDRATGYFTLWEHEKMIRTRSISTVVLHLIPLVGEVEAVE